MLVPGIPTGDLVAIASGPNYVGIGQIWNGKAGLASSHAMIPAGFLRVDRHAGTAHVSIVLHVAVEVVRNLVVDINVVHLADWQSNAVKAAAVNGSNYHSRVIGDYKPIGIGWIDPNIVSVSAPVDFLKILSSVQRLMERTVGDVNLVVGSGRDGDANVIAGAPNQSPLEIDGLPARPCVVGPPNRALVLGLNQGEDAPGVGRSDSYVNLADRSMWQAVLFDARPLGSPVA